jgi:hypothetical protein
MSAIALACRPCSEALAEGPVTRNRFKSDTPSTLGLPSPVADSRA